ncbi:YegS/Rv2252/BmrU family lipid kinase [Anaerocolumna sedimenticola]|uniref:YegS/Rv2252/BmrU family lipid kinase n=1 Tax=Anaerocolumna sedimenticola TaxID=2696063 RepID=A0A6P1TK52_9FIRM|nr:diacylglycerol kinase family protein [Anaerocolumna sedimenticola]QHQ60813.1 YegS/Rv2252/BmrU family lipid kinase [Anaerocolumna sedimenticola]
MYHFIINPKSRSEKGAKIWHIVKEVLDKKEVSYTFHITRYPNHATELAMEICSTYSGIKNIIVLGGDGTVNEVINGITDFNDVLLGYIPSGSSNDLARSLKLPKDPVKSLENILFPSRFQYVDIGLIKSYVSNYSRKFAVSSGIGFDAAICEETFHSKLKIFLNRYGLGKLTYIIICLKQLISCRFMDGMVTVDGGKPQTYKKILLITNMIHKYEGGGMQIAPAADPYDGKLSVCIVHGVSRLRILTVLPFLLFGKHIHFKGVVTFNCRLLDIEVDNPYWVHIDGECPDTFSQLTVSCITNQLRIIV